MIVFLDSSALAKKYVEEVGSERVEEILSSATQLLLSVICEPEVVSVLCRRRREGTLDAESYQTAKTALFAHARTASITALTEPVLARAISLLERFTLRCSDALHVASAIEGSADVFVSADHRQCEAAAACGMRVEMLMVSAQGPR